MAKTSAKSTISPYQFVDGAEIKSDHLVEVIEQQNWSRTYRGSLVYLSGNYAPNYELGPGAVTGVWGYDALGGPGLVGLWFSDSVTFETRIDIPIITPPCVTHLRVSARCQMASGSSGEVKFSWYDAPDIASVTLAFAFADNGTTKSGVIDFSAYANATDHHEARLLVQLSRTAGSGPYNATARNLFVRADYDSIGTPSPAY